MARETETIEQLKARLSQQEADRKAEMQAKLAPLDAQVAARKAKEAAAKMEQERAREEAWQTQASEKFDAEHMEPAKRTWLANGGTLAEFEEAKPQLRKKLLEELSVKKSDRARSAFAQRARARYR